MAKNEYYGSLFTVGAAIFKSQVGGCEDPPVFQEGNPFECFSQT